MSSTSSNPALAKLRRRVAQAPEEPGVYRWLDDEGKVLYVGKAKNLRSRMRSYVTPASWEGLGPWKQSLMEHAQDYDVTIVRSEVEALMLETNLIKELRPKYNILMKDDKHYVYVRVTMRDTYPRIDLVRKVEKDGSKYFGPKMSGYETQQTLQILRTLFPYRTCKMKIELQNEDQSARPRAQDLSQPGTAALGNGGVPLDVICTHKDRPTPCLDHHIGQCLAPCIGSISPQEYRERCIDPVLRFLKGDQQFVLPIIKERMMIAAKEKKFELAAKLRDHCTRFETMQQKQTVSDATGADTDVIGVSLLSNRAYVVLLQERGGKVIADLSFPLQGAPENVCDVLAQFVPQYYASTEDLPRTILLPEECEGQEALATMLTEKAERKVEIVVPERGKKNSLMDLAMRNAEQKAKQAEASWEAEARNVSTALNELKNAIGLKTEPKRIEGYDISHLGGTETVGSMVVMIDGKPANKQYRHFAIHTMKSGEIDDYRSLKEVLSRRLRHVAGSLNLEMQQWEKMGVIVGKARKEDQEKLEELIHGDEAELSQRAISYKNFFIAREGEEIAGFVQLRGQEEKLPELSSLWVAPKYRGHKLGAFLARSILKTVKKGKVYITLYPQLEHFYSEIGFRYIENPPKKLQEIMDKYDAEDPTDVKAIAMMYDTLQNKPDSSLSSRPDLLMIDGGKGQLGVVVEVLKNMNLDIPVISLAKREEEVFVPGNPVSLDLPKDSPARFMLMRLRDEAHRFANRLREMKAKNTLFGKN